MTSPKYQPMRDRIIVPTPAVGTNWSFNNDHGEHLLVRSVLFTLVTSAVVATRVVGMQIAADTTVWYKTAAATGQVASLTRSYMAIPNGTAGGDSAAAIMMAWSQDGVLIPPGHVLSATTVALDVGDQYSAVVLDVYRFSPALEGWTAPVPNIYRYDERS